MTAMISIKGVTRVFDSRDGDRIVALQDVSLDIAANQFITLVGPSGCGKSTLLRIVAGLILPTSGEASIGGVPIPGPRAAGRRALRDVLRCDPSHASARDHLERSAVR